MLNAGRQVLAFIVVTGATIAVVDSRSRTAIFTIFRYPAGAVFIYGLSMTLVWLMRDVVTVRLSASVLSPAAFRDRSPPPSTSRRRDVQMAALQEPRRAVEFLGQTIAQKNRALWPRARNPRG